jgi:photosystem II stability/assembly factor-like uncharacterized protein
VRYFFILLLFSMASSASAQSSASVSVTVAPNMQMDNQMTQGMKYRLVGPFRASRTVGGVGIPSQPNVFYIGVNNGGVWKTDDFGRTWNPIFDQAPTGSIGDIAVSPSHPNIIYVGSGEGLHRPDLSVGDGIFKSTDGGASWSFVGLPDIQQVGRLIVHPTNPDVVFVAGLGHPYGANEERGVFRTVDGGKSWEKVLYIDHNTGAIQVEFDPSDPNTLFADMWDNQEGPWENANWSGPNSGLYKSSDGGSTWRKITTGLPTAAEGLGRIGVGIAPSDSKQMYATVDARENGGIYRSDDAGESWELIHSDRRLWGRGSDFAEIRVHPENPDQVFVANVASYRSDDGGKTWMSIKGAPGGDDYHRIWINPLNGNIMLFVTDQGATITVNGGKTWSSWYNQPTAQLYHVTTDNQFPYWIYGGQQESGSIGIASRGNGGQISFRDWIGVGADEYAYIAPDPLNPDWIYGGRVVRHDMRTGQTQNVAPEALRSGKYRIKRTMPLLFHPADPSMLLFATNVLWRTTNGGDSWDIISPDLSDPRPEVPSSIGDHRTPEMENMDRVGVIYAIDGSPLDVNTIWAGTDDGLVHVTRNGGKTWTNVTPPALRSWDKISQIDASHFDANTAYIAVNAIRLDDQTPYMYRTRDGGATWTLITAGMEGSGPINVIREDPAARGLLFAGSERSVYYSVDDGASWNSLRLNLPPSSMRDLVIKDNDLVVGTHGRSIWILDNIAPLREMAAAAEAKDPFLFAPQPALRVRWNMFSDTPLPPEEPTGQNPPDGAILDYYLPRSAGMVKLEVLDEQGIAIRSYSSQDLPTQIDTTSLPHPTYWIRPWQALSAESGHHRFVWDLRREPPRGSRRQYSIAAVQWNTPDGPLGPFVHPGTYTVRLTVDGVVQERPISVALDPRVDISHADLQLQSKYSLLVYEAYQRIQGAVENIDRRLSSSTLSESVRTMLSDIRGRGAAGDPDIVYSSINQAEIQDETFVGLQEKFQYLLNVYQASDSRPTSQSIKAAESLKQRLDEMFVRLDAIK